MMQWKYTLYLFQHLISLALSEIGPRFCGSTMPGSIISSPPIPTHFEPEPLCHINIISMTPVVRRSVGGRHSAFLLHHFTPTASKWCISLRWRVEVLHQLCSSTICGQIECIYLCRETYILHAILWCSKSCDCDCDKYNKMKCLEVLREPLLWEYGIKSPAELHSSLSCSRCIAQWSQHPLKSFTDLHRGLSSSKIWLLYNSNLVASLMHLYNCRCFQEHLTILLESLGALCLAPGGSWSI